MPCSLKESFLRVPSFLPEFFVLILPFVQGSQSVLRINVSTQTRRMQETVGLPWEMLRFSCMSFLHEMRDSFSRIKRGFVSFSFQNMAHIGLYLASLHLYNAVRSHAKEYHPAATRLLCIHWASGQIRLSPPGCGSKEFFYKLKGRLHCLPFCFCAVFIPRQKWLSSHRSSAQHAHNPQPRLLQTPLHAWLRQQPRSSLF